MMSDTMLYLPSQSGRCKRLKISWLEITHLHSNDNYGFVHILEVKIVFLQIISVIYFNDQCESVN